MSDDYTPGAEVMQSARELRDNVFRDPGIDSMTLSAGGKSVTIGRDVRRQATPPAQEEALPFQPAARDCILGRPDERIKVPYPDHGINRHGDDIAYDFVRDDQLAEIAEGLIERYAKRYGMLEKIDIVYGWARELPDTNGSATLIKLKKADAFLWWAINDGQVRGRFPHVYVLLNRLVAGYAELTMWQVQAAIHTALECIMIQRGKVKLAHPTSQSANLFIARRYGAWSPDLQAIGAALRKAESEQLPLFEETDEDEEGAGDDE